MHSHLDSASRAVRIKTARMMPPTHPSSKLGVYSTPLDTTNKFDREDSMIFWSAFKIKASPHP